VTFAAPRSAVQLFFAHLTRACQTPRPTCRLPPRQAGVSQSPAPDHPALVAAVPLGEALLRRSVPEEIPL